VTRRTALSALAVYAVLLGALVFSPVGPSLKGIPLPGWLHAGAVEAAANVVVFVPVGFLVALLLPRGRRWLAVLLCCLLSTGIELVQAVFISTRLGSARDVLTNTTGAVIGLVGCSLWLRTRWSRRPERPEQGASLSEGMSPS
jgi:glycopeptide antibiotics resistance protein